MIDKEISEVRRHLRRDRSAITHLFGCYVNDAREIVTEFRQSVSLMPENESDKFFAMLRKVLSGTVGKNLIDITFQTAQVADSPEHKLLMQLRDSRLEDEEVRTSFYQKVIESVTLEGSFVIVAGCDSYDVPFKGKDGSSHGDQSEEVYRFLVCAVCPVKQTKSSLHYVSEEKLFRDGAVNSVMGAPALGFLFPAFDDRATNIYNALYYTHDTQNAQEEFIDAIFHTPAPLPAQEQKKTFEALLTTCLGDECSMEVVQTVHDRLCQRMELHKESKDPQTLMITKEDVKDVLGECGVSQEHIAKFSVDYDEAFGFEAELHPSNIIDSKHFEVKTPDVVIRVDPTRTELVETRIIGGVKYILIQADENVEVNGVNISIRPELAQIP